MNAHPDKKSLDDILIEDVADKLKTAQETVQALLEDRKYNPELTPTLNPDYIGLRARLNKVKNELGQAISIFEIIKMVYSKKDLFKEEDIQEMGGIIVHRMNNKLTVPLGQTEVLLRNLTSPDSSPYLKDHYENLHSQITAINTLVYSASQFLGDLARLYKAKEEDVELVNASGLDKEVVTYRVVHVDDEQNIRDGVGAALSLDSNLVPKSDGIFGHDGKRVKYDVKKFESAQAALEYLHAQGEAIDILLTDREMPGLSGIDLLNILTDQNDKKARVSAFAHVRNVAMLTAGLSIDEAGALKTTYGIEIMSKPFRSLSLEKQIYGIVRPK